LKQSKISEKNKWGQSLANPHKRMNKNKEISKKERNIHGIW
jgi:hypothetical protein